ncbi:MAG: class I SAM-dependent methyltransferase [Candidatus Levybacteria bacterium]|nr:class I SAM-dependent methyltransferase [Candidatus Levybacteria bacterium]
MTKYKGTKTLEVLEGADNYNKWIASSLMPHVKSPALEIGAGTGNISEYFTHIKDLVLSDNDSQLVRKLSEKFKKNVNIAVEVLDVASNISKVKRQFKTIFAINVLEHIEDDLKALQNMNMLLEKGGRVVLLVPAKKFAFTDLDKNLGHFRRYEKNELQEKIKHAGFELEKIEFFNFLGLLSWLVRDRVSRGEEHLKKSHVKLFDFIVPILKVIEPKSRLPIGISLIVVARKK